MKEKTSALKATVKERAEQSRVIRAEKTRVKTETEDRKSESYRSLMLNLAYRRGSTRSKSRVANLAYAFVRGRPYALLEAKTEVPVGYFSRAIAALAEVEEEAVKAWLEARAEAASEAA